MSETGENDLEKTYRPEPIEQKWYQVWSERGCFKLSPHLDDKKDRKTFSVVMPPPNVTGKLHMGHALNNTCQDILVRYKRMQGFEVLWIPGCDHAGIATQSVVEKKLMQEQKQTRQELGREKFLEHVWHWKNEYGSNIVEQLKKLGVSCNWDYFTFTMDPSANKAVRRAFVELYRQGLIYRAERIIHWDPQLQSAISDAEVEFKEVKGKFYHLKYKVEDSEEYLVVATTRPETLFGDTAVAVHPLDERYSHLIGKRVKLPLTDRTIPIIFDEHVDRELGTGCLKVTPGHDFNDFEIGKRHQLPIITILTKSGKFNQHADLIEGLNPQQARPKVIAALEEVGSLLEIKDHVMLVGHGERSGGVVEPMVSLQWFLNVGEMASTAVRAVEKKKMRFIPETWQNTYFSWLRQPKDWCLSRQLWWGHRIPVFNCESCQFQWAAESDPTDCPQCKSHHVKQDEDVLDTWFSSALWPMTTLGWPDATLMKQKHYDRFYPNQVLTTGHDIIFFWVARMMMMCTHFAGGQIPFKDVYIHAIVRDKLGRKMSKSLNNGIDPLEMIEKYGCDAVRFTLAAGAGLSRNFNLDPLKIESYRNFMNKIWNAFRFVKPFMDSVSEGDVSKLNLNELGIQEKWILAELNDVIESVTKSIEEYRFDDACKSLYAFVYDSFCSWFLELSKGILYKTEGREKQIRAAVLKYVFSDILKLLHPFSPFLSEELWSQLHPSLLISEVFPKMNKDFKKFKEEKTRLNEMIEMVTQVRNLRASLNLAPKIPIRIQVNAKTHPTAKFFFDNQYNLFHLARIKRAKVRSLSKTDRPRKTIISPLSFGEVFLFLEGVVDIQKEILRNERQLTRLDQELRAVQQKLGNPSFTDRAPEEVVAEVREKAELLIHQKSVVEDSLARLKD
ncbi:MAG: valine--tRNA ligase [Bacteriovoracaceae bacterium]|nr:valine--tRNA ligase [Bacteriovoracaceae bacterium]